MNQHEYIQALLKLALDVRLDVSTPASAKGRGFFCIFGNKGPRWIIPADPCFGLPVLRNWQPYDFSSRVQWQILLKLYQYGFLAKMPGISQLQAMAKPDELEVPVIYIGTPGPQQKAVITMVSEKTGEPLRVMKTIIVEGARAAIQHEAAVLRELAESAPRFNAPVLLELAADGSWATQSVIPGKLSGRKLTPAHVDWLLQLPETGKTTSIDEQCQYTRELIADNPFMDNRMKLFMHRAARKINGPTIAFVFVHGDFVPWNLKTQPKRAIAAIDWEDGNFTGLPLWDLCHFFYMQHHLFQGKITPVELLKNSPLVTHYLEMIEISPNHLVPLILLYLLQTIADRNKVVSKQYKKYLIKQVEKIV